MRGWHEIRFRRHIAKVFTWQTPPFGLWRLELGPELVFLFWRYVRPAARRAVSQVMAMGLPGYLAGYCSQGRGLSWDRRSRYGEK